MEPSPLARPLGLLMRPTFMADLQDSLELAAGKLRENGCPVLPVTENGLLAGAVTEAALIDALGSGMALNASIEPLVRGVLSARVSDTGAEALRLFENNQASALIVIDDSGRVHGLLTPSDLFPKRTAPPRPSMVGGMATPFGVYLTTGSIRAGVGDLALMSTGAVMMVLLIIASLVSGALFGFLFRHGVPPGVANTLNAVLPYALFLLGMRLIPLSGIHAAEHKVVHAIERGQELTPAAVRRMPRVHPRCGTNLAVGASIFMAVSSTTLFPSYDMVRVVIAAVATLALWRPLGNTMQFYVTTKTPTKKQLDMGIRSGRELLDKFSRQGGASPTILRRLYCSGMFHVIAGSMLTSAVYAGIVVAFHLPVDII